MTKLAYTVNETAELLSIGRDAVYDLLYTRRLKSVKIGRRRVVSHSAIVEFLNEEATEGIAR